MIDPEPSIKNALESPEFTTDLPNEVGKRLDECLRIDFKHILPKSKGGNSGTHVAAIQNALMSIRKKSPDLGLPAITDANGDYGPSTVAAVLKYKMANGIQRRGQPMDDIVGRMTISRIDDELMNRRRTPVIKTTIDTVFFWINAFIPSQVPGLTRQLILGPDKGKSAIEFFGIFSTDNRSFSTSPVASARMHLEFTLDVKTFKVKSNLGRCNESKAYDSILHGHITDRKTATPTFSVDDSTGVIKFSISAGNPLAPPGAPDIDVIGSLNASGIGTKLEIDCLLDGFPFYEAYVVANNAPPFKCFEAPPLPGNTPLNLIGAPTRRVHVIVADTNGDALYDARTILPDSVQPVS